MIGSASEDDRFGQLRAILAANETPCRSKSRWGRQRCFVGFENGWPRNKDRPPIPELQRNSRSKPAPNFSPIRSEASAWSRRYHASHGIPPASAGNSSGHSLASDWSLGGRSQLPGHGYRPANGSRGDSRGGFPGGVRSVATAGGASRAAVLPSAGVDASRIRPATGLARADRRRAAGTPASPSSMRPVESAGHYRSLLRSKIEEVVAEIDRLRSEAETADGASESRRALERRSAELSEAVRGLEGDLADLNLAREYERAGAEPEDLRHATTAIARRNGKTEEEIDAVFFARKEAEEEIARLESERERVHSAVEAKLLAEDGDGARRVREYRHLVKAMECAMHLDANQETMALLEHQKKARMEELEGIDTLEERIVVELEELRTQAMHMREEIDKYGNLGELRDSFDVRRGRLAETREKFVEGVRLLDELLAEASSNGPDAGSIGQNGLKQPRFDYGDVKAECLRLMEDINGRIVVRSQ
ncbi:hypothetical protein ACHAWF_012645 [Thalassiosira exigua]